MYIVESARVLREHVEFLAQSRECPSVDGVRMGSAHHVGSGFVDLGVNHERCRVEESVWARTFLDLGVVIYQEQITRLDEGKMFALCMPQSELSKQKT